MGSESGSVIELKTGFRTHHLVVGVQIELVFTLIWTNCFLRHNIFVLLQRAWLLKLVALELHVGDMDIILHRDSCRHLLNRLFLREPLGWETTGMPSNLMPPRLTMTPSDTSLHKIKVNHPKT